MLTSRFHLPAILASSACSGPGVAAFMYFSIISFSFGAPAGAAAGLASAGLAAASAGLAASALAGSSARATGAKSAAAANMAKTDDFFIGCSLLMVVTLGDQPTFSAVRAVRRVSNGNAVATATRAAR